MTRERAIEVLKAWDLNWSDNFTANEFEQAFNMAINSLEVDEQYQLEYEEMESGGTELNKDDILIVKYPYSMKSDKVNQLHDNILKQKETGVIVLPDCCEVVIAPKDVEIKTDVIPVKWIEEFIKDSLFDTTELEDMLLQWRKEREINELRTIRPSEESST